MDITELLTFAHRSGASDVHLTVRRAAAGAHPRRHEAARAPAAVAPKKCTTWCSTSCRDALRRHVPGDQRRRLLVRARRPRPLPRQRLPRPARRGRGLPNHSDQGHDHRGARPAADPQGGLRQGEGPRAGHRPDRLRQVDHAGGDDRLHQRELRGAHPHHRGSDRVRAPLEEVPGQPARGRAAHDVVHRAPCAARCARIPTSSWSAKCATWRPSRWR